MYKFLSAQHQLSETLLYLRNIQFAPRGARWERDWSAKECYLCFRPFGRYRHVSSHLKKGGLVDDTELEAGENGEAARRTARRLELFGSTLDLFGSCWLDISKPVSPFCPIMLLLLLELDTLLREIFRLIASKRSCFSSSLGLDGSSTGFRVVISDWSWSSTPASSSDDCFTELPVDPSEGVTDVVANVDCEIVDENSVVAGDTAGVDSVRSGDELEPVGTCCLLDFVT